VTRPRLYGELADWFHLLTHPKSYWEEAETFTRIIREHGGDGVRTVLELGSGGGNNASHMKKHFRLTLTDISPDMLALSETINPECEHIEGDMRTLRLGRKFDAVFVHDAVAYLTNVEDLEAAMRTAHQHLDTGGVALFVPDNTTENFEPRTTSGGYNEGDRALRYLEWIHPAVGNTVEITFAYVLREGTSERVETDKHIVGLFPRATWISLLDRVGFNVTTLPYRHSEFAPGEQYEVFVGRRRP
jgi:SAM-dependent methyltransferase